MIKIAIYGKGGIGKSTTTSNIAVALSRLGKKVMQIGCDPKSDSTKVIMGGVSIPTVLDKIRTSGDDIELEDIVFEGESGVLCVEAGGPTPGIGCAGRGIITAFEKLNELDAFEVYKPDVVLYDVLGDVVCGGFAMPLRGEYSDLVFVVTSGEMMSMYAASNIVSAVNNFKKRGYANFAGFILNSRNVENEYELVSKLAQETGGEIIEHIPRSPKIQEAEHGNKTVVEMFPDEEITKTYIILANKILESSNENQ